MAGIIITAILIIAVFLTIVIIAVHTASKREQAIYANGIEVDSVVVRCDASLNQDHDTRYRYYVKYKGNDGSEHEGLLNVRTTMPVGRKVRIRYIPGSYDEVVFVSQELE